jgi:hypothetical protein
VTRLTRKLFGKPVLKCTNTLSSQPSFHSFHSFLRDAQPHTAEPSLPVQCLSNAHSGKRALHTIDPIFSSPSSFLYKAVDVRYSDILQPLG